MVNNDLDGSLTLLLVTKDRERFLHRWMSYAESIKLPFKVFIADGGKGTCSFLNNGSFPSVNYTYRKYPYDKTFSEFYSKVVNALNEINTSFTVWADDDDLYMINGLRNSLNFLSINPTYNACRGILGFFNIISSNNKDLLSDVYGNSVKYNIISKPFNENECSVYEDNIIKRLNNYLSLKTPTWYDLRRTKDLKYLWTKIRDYDFNNLLLAECFLDIMTVINGNIKRLSNINNNLYLMRQTPPPESVARTFREEFGDSFNQMLVDTWSEDYKKYTDGIQAFIQEKEQSISKNEAQEIAKKSFRSYYANSIIKELSEEKNQLTRSLKLKSINSIKFYSKYFKRMHHPFLKKLVYEKTNLELNHAVKFLVKNE